MSHLYGQTSLLMGAEQRHMTEMIYDLALEIIFLLTGEKHAAVKMASFEVLLQGMYPPLSAGGSLSQASITKSPSPSVIPQSNNQKILEVISRIAALLAGEVSGRENSRNLEKDTFLEDRVPLTSEDGLRKRNPSERCLSPLDSPNSIQEGSKTPFHHQICEEMNLRTLKEEQYGDDEWCEEAEEELPKDSTQEDHYHPHYYQDTNLLVIKQEEEVNVRDGEPSKEQEISSHTSADWGLSHKIQKVHPNTFTNIGIQNEQYFIPDSLDVMTPSLHSIHSSEKKFICAECGRSFFEELSLIRHEQVHRLALSETHLLHSNFIRQERSQRNEKPYSCSECGKCFSKKFSFITHKRVHTGEKPYSCTVCGKCFSQKAVLIRHERIHTGVKPYSCSDCGKCFSQKTVLIVHKRVHTGEKPYSCSVCGKCFTHKSNLLRHEQAHVGKNSVLEMFNKSLRTGNS